ncbi:MAG: hypothetical protein ICV85_19150 [Tolypothrix sp. T3-bin4]|nr:hypothetical protein [Tolypothrix sp. T3-bin4]
MRKHLSEDTATRLSPTRSLHGAFPPHFSPNLIKLSQKCDRVSGRYPKGIYKCIVQ